MDYKLSKSKYCSAQQCPKMLWLNKNKPEEFDEASVNQAIMDTGSEVGDLAMSLFGDYVEVPYGDLGDMISITQKLLAENTPIIAEASFSIDGLFCSVDLLKSSGNNEVDIYEVKSSTSLKEQYYDDVAFQCYVLSKSGYKVNSCNLVHINNQYVRQGDLELDKLFAIEDMTQEVLAMQSLVEENVKFIRQYMEQTEEPVLDIGEYCFSPYNCGFWHYCTRHLPQPNIFDVARVNLSTKFDYYYNDLVSFTDLAKTSVLPASQYLQVKHEISDCPPEIDVNNIGRFISELSYPLYFLDFESFQPAIPLFDNSKPYEQIVFQYSLHYIEKEGGELQHKEFLATPGGDPRRALAEQLCQDIPIDGCTLAYNMGFEKGRIRGLAELYPDLQEHLMNIHDNIKDLMIPFQKKWYYTKAMQGSYSIKYVLPALFPNEPSLDYHNLDGVHNGGEASELYAKMTNMTSSEVAIARKHLLKYCGLDTFAMVKIWEKLCNICQ